MTAGAIVVAVLAFALLVVVHEAGHAVAARLSGMRVERFSVGFGPALARFRRGETEYVLSALPLGGYVKIAGMAPGEEVAAADPRNFSNQPAWRRFLVIAAGPAMNYLLAIALATALAATLGFAVRDPSSSVGVLEPGYPAERAGLAEGDRVLSVGGTPVSTWDDLVREIQRRPGQATPIEVERAEGGAARRLALTLVPREEGGVGRAGFGQHLLRERRAGLGAIALGVGQTHATAGATLSALARIFSREKGAPKLHGPLRIGEEMARAAQRGGEALVHILFNISVALALFNLLPVPGLDGGRLVFLGYEIVARRRANERIESILHAIGIALLLVLLLGVTVFGDLPGLLRR
jgi:regulator of sigma E protease